jgi:predicted nicotinamide N-methyase
VQIASNSLPIEKGGVVVRWSDISACLVESKPASGSNHQGNGETAWCFTSDAVSWSKGLTPLRSTATILSNLKCLSREGAYWSVHNKWKRVYITRCGVAITVVEDVPESGGQNCIWAAGIVMARFIEHPTQAIIFRNARVLELGAGCGLTSMVASIVGAHIFTTEQDSCMPYLQYNLNLNPDIFVSVKTLQWMSDYKGELFDYVIGGDITYDVNMIEAIFTTFHACLKPTGTVYLCHDNDSCPMSPKVYSRLVSLAAVKLFSVEEIRYEEFVDPEFFSSTVKMWKFCRVATTNTM